MSVRNLSLYLFILVLSFQLLTGLAWRSERHSGPERHPAHSEPSDHGAVPTLEPYSLSDLEDENSILWYLEDDEDGSTQRIRAINYGFSSLTDKPMILLMGDAVAVPGFRNDSGVYHYTGWAAMLNETLGGAAHLVNMGVGAVSSRSLARAMPSIQRQLTPYTRNVALAVVCYGAHDALLQIRERPGINVTSYISNMQTSLSSLKGMGIKIVLVTPPPVTTDRRSSPKQDRMASISTQYARAAVALGRSLNIPTVNIQKLMTSTSTGQSPLLAKHQQQLSETGNKMVFRALWQAISSSYPFITRAGLENWQETYESHY